RRQHLGPARPHRARLDAVRESARAARAAELPDADGRALPPRQSDVRAAREQPGRRGDREARRGRPQQAHVLGNGVGSRRRRYAALAAAAAGALVAGSVGAGAPPWFAKGDTWTIPLVGPLEDGLLLVPALVNGKGPF